MMSRYIPCKTSTGLPIVYTVSPTCTYNPSLEPTAPSALLARCYVPEGYSCPLTTLEIKAFDQGLLTDDDMRNDMRDVYAEAAAEQAGKIADAVQLPPANITKVQVLLL